MFRSKINFLKSELKNMHIDIETFEKELKKIESANEGLAIAILNMLNSILATEENAVEEVKICQIIANTLNLFRKNFESSGIELRYSGSPNGNIVCRPKLLSQAISNLLKNSIQAVESQKESWIDVSVLIRNKYLVISIMDSGPFASKSSMKKAMLPFYTTKNLNGCFGLGLNLSKAIIDAHQGSLFYDQTSVHTKFVIILPMKKINKSTKSST